MNSFKKYLGAILVILSAIFLIVSFVFTDWHNYNGVLIGSLVVMIAGLLLHIFLGRKE